MRSNIMTEIERNVTEHDDLKSSHPKGIAIVMNEDIKETAMGIALEFFDYPVFPGEARDDFLAKRDLMAFGIKLLLKKSKIPCEEKGMFIKER
jgi:hypothetical protein